MVTPEEILSYYASAEFKPVFPSDLSHRHFRFKNANKNWRKPPFPIRNVEDLQRWVVKMGGLDIYYGLSCWLEPEKVGPKDCSGSYLVADNLLLSNTLAFDVDAEEPVTLEGLDHARKITNNIYELMKAHKNLYDFEYFAITGYKGFRLTYTDKTKLPEDPRKRIHFMEKYRNVFIQELIRESKEKKGPLLYKVDVSFDEKVTTNAMSVIRVLGTVHSSTGYISTKLPVDLLRQPIRKILNHVPYIGKERPGIPAKGNDKPRRANVPRPRALSSTKDASGLASSSIINHRYFFSNKVLGIHKGYIPIFIYNQNQNFEEEVRRLQRKYGLGPLYVYADENKTIVVSLKTMQRRQLQKVLNQSSSYTKINFLRYRRIAAPYTMTFSRMIPGVVTGHISRGHHHWVKPGQRVPDNSCGWEMIEMLRAVPEDQT